MVTVSSKIKKGIRFCTRYFTRAFSPQRFAALPAPHVSIETTNRCAARCVFCANQIMKRPRQELDFQLFVKTVDECVQMGVSELNFNATIGDPLLDSRLFDRVRYVKKHPQFVQLGFSTTLQAFHTLDIDEFFNSGITWIQISCVLSGARRYKEFFGIDCYAVVLSNLYTLIKENRKRGNQLSITLGIKPTDEPIEVVLAHPDFKAINALLDQDLVANVTGRGFYCDDWVGTVTLPSYLRRRPRYLRLFRPCRLLYQTLMIFSNGNVGVCACRDFEADSELILGNVGSQRLSEMWEGPQLKQLRALWRAKNKVPQICRQCRHYLY